MIEKDSYKLCPTSAARLGTTRPLAQVLVGQTTVTITVIDSHEAVELDSFVLLREPNLVGSTLSCSEHVIEDALKTLFRTVEFKQIPKSCIKADIYQHLGHKSQNNVTKYPKSSLGFRASQKFGNNHIL